jgi:hypothetical protein
MANYTGLQRTLISKAGEYAQLGFKVGYAKGKSFLAEYKPAPTFMAFGMAVAKGEPESPDDFDGISLLPENIACVDFDEPDFGLICDGELPSTWKEKTPRGWHLFYNLPDKPAPWEPKVKYRNAPVDLLTASAEKVNRYGGTNKSWGNHILISPTPGYVRCWPEGNSPPNKTQLAEAPRWLVDALLR